MQQVQRLHLLLPMVVRRLSFLILCVTVPSCGGAEVSTGAPSSLRCQAAVAGIPPTVPSDGGRLVAFVTASRDCLWSAASEVAWMQVSPSSGQGDAALSLAIAENPANTARSGAFVLNAARFDVVQEPAAVEPLPPPAPPVAASDAPDPAPPAPDAPPQPEPPPTPGATEEPAPAPPPVTPPPAPPAPAPSAPTSPSGPPPPEPSPVRVTIDGRVSGLSGACPTLSFSLGAHAVETDGRTRFTGGNCRALRNGADAEVEGDRLASGAVYAVRVELENK